jgi:hypothetical protein
LLAAASESWELPDAALGTAEAVCSSAILETSLKNLYQQHKTTSSPDSLYIFTVNNVITVNQMDLINKR